MTQRAITVWAEIPVSDLDRAVRFYNAVFDYQMTVDRSGPKAMALLGNQMEVAGANLYEGTPARAGGPTVHLELPGDLESGVARLQDAGGTVDGAPVSIPAGRYVHARDPDGNSISLFEAA
jgi:predicted enzyme related to lactoylglutathione lyase